MQPDISIFVITDNRNGHAKSVTSFVSAHISSISCKIFMTEKYIKELLNTKWNEYYTQSAFSKSLNFFKAINC